MSVKLAPIFNDAQFINAIPANGALLFTYAAGSSTKQNTYTGIDGLTAQANPIVLNSRGEPASPIWLTAGQTYKFVFAPSTDSDPPVSPIRTIDNISGVNDTALTIDQWISPGLTPTYVSATQFTLAGDQTTAFQVGRRFQATVTAGTVVGRISASAFAALTTVTVVTDSGALDSGLSAVQLGLITTDNTSFPVIKDNNFRVSGSSDKTKLVALEVDGLTTATTRTMTVQDADGTIAYLTNITKNILVNGGMEFATRGANGTASFAVPAATTGQYVTDNWALTTAASTASVVSQQAGLTNQSQFCARVQRNNAQTGLNFYFEQAFKTTDIVKLRGQTLTISFYARAGANWSPASGNLPFGIYWGTGAQGKKAAGSYTGETSSTSTAVLTTTITKYTLTTSAVPLTATQMTLMFNPTLVGTAGAADYFEIDDVQINTGSGTTYEIRKDTEELVLIEEQFFKTFPLTVAPAQSGGVTGALQYFPPGANRFSTNVTWPVRMLKAPTVTTYNPSAANANWRDVTDSTDQTVVTGTATESGFAVGSSASGTTGGANHAIHLAADAGL
jgi:hypothetical protein